MFEKCHQLPGVTQSLQVSCIPGNRPDITLLEPVPYPNMLNQYPVSPGTAGQAFWGARIRTRDHGTRTSRSGREAEGACARGPRPGEAARLSRGDGRSSRPTRGHAHEADPALLARDLNLRKTELLHHPGIGNEMARHALCCEDRRAHG
jgi:hypothetical protein